MVFNRAERITAWRPAPRKIQRARDFSRIPANGIRKGLGHWRAFISLANVNLFRGGHRRDERWRTVVRRHGTFAAKSAFNAAAAVLDRLFTSANPEFRRRSRERELLRRSPSMVPRYFSPSQTRWNEPKEDGRYSTVHRWIRPWRRLLRDVRINRVDIQILNVYVKGRLIYKRISTNFCYGILTFFLLRRNIIFRVSFRIEQFVIKKRKL